MTEDTFDPWPAPTEPISLPEPPVLWPKLKTKTRGIIGAAAVALLAEFRGGTPALTLTVPDMAGDHQTHEVPGPAGRIDFAWLAARLWERVRADRDVERELSRDERITAITPELQGVLMALSETDNILMNLHARRRELDRAIEQCERIVGRSTTTKGAA